MFCNLRPFKFVVSSSVSKFFAFCFQNMFFVTGDFSVTYISADQLRIELKAGGLNQNQEDHVIRHILQSSDTGEVRICQSFSRTRDFSKLRLDSRDGLT